MTQKAIGYLKVGDLVRFKTVMNHSYNGIWKVIDVDRHRANRVTIEKTDCGATKNYKAQVVAYQTRLEIVFSI